MSIPPVSITAPCANVNPVGHSVPKGVVSRWPNWFCCALLFGPLALMMTSYDLLSELLARLLPRRIRR